MSNCKQLLKSDCVRRESILIFHRQFQIPTTLLSALALTSFDNMAGRVIVKLHQRILTMSSTMVAIRTLAFQEDVFH